MKVQNAPSLDGSALGLVVLIGLGIAGFVWFNGTMNHVRTEKMKPVAEQVQSANRPRVIEFYADWCGPCRAYGPIVEACEKKYSDKVDFQRLNVDDPKNREMSQMFDVSSIPKTCILDRNGKAVANFTGGVSAERLDAMVEQVIAN